MLVRWNLGWTEIDRTRVRAAADAVRALHADLEVAVELSTPPRDFASIFVRVPKARADEIQRAADPNASWPATYPDRGYASGDSYRVRIAILRVTREPYQLVVSDEDADNDPCWGVATVLGNRVAHVLGGELVEDD